MFCPKALLPSLLVLPTPKFQHQLAFFYLTLICVFTKLLGPSSLECARVPLVHQQASSLPISKGGINLVSAKVIAPTSYLGSWGLVGPIVTSIFLQNGCSFLLGAIGAINSNPLPFQVDLRWVHDLLLPIVQIFQLPFEQSSKKGADHLQDNILKNVHDFIFQYHLTIVFRLSLCSLKSYASPSSGAWLSIYLIIP